MDSTTAISDLPSGGGGGGISSIQPAMGAPVLPAQLEPIKIEKGKPQLTVEPYQPLNVHSNPYLGDGSAEGEAGLQELPYPKLNSLKPQPPGPAPTHRLPSRDIPNNHAGYALDDTARATYIPQAPQKDYVREEAPKIETRRRRKKSEKWATFVGEMQIPAFVALLFFMFTTATIGDWINRTLRGVLPGLFHGDGNITVYGTMIKAGLFGLTYYTALKAVDFMLREED